MTDQSHYAHLNVLQGLNRQIQTIIGNAQSMDATGDHNDPWESAYDLVFSDAISKRVYAELREMNQSLDYYDPDTTYEEDVQAFADAVDSKVGELNNLLNGFEPGM